MKLSSLGHDLQRELTPPYVDDGLIEIVGFKDAWHGLVLLTPKGHGTRLAQVIILSLNKILSKPSFTNLAKEIIITMSMLEHLDKMTRNIFGLVDSNLD